MLIGGAPGSIAGGVKITTIFVLGAFLVRKADKNGDFKVAHHRIAEDSVHKGILYVFKALVLLFISVTALTILDGLSGKSFGPLVFECISAFATVGLSLGATSTLSLAGKWLIIAVMFFGRVGLITLAFPSLIRKQPGISYPKGSLLME
jgi:trk system potassium uptake protein TrkH